MPFKNPRKPLNSCLAATFLHLSSIGNLSEALTHLELLSKKGIRLPSKTLVHLLRRCGDAKALKEGKWIHLHLKVTGKKRPDTFLGNNLIEMYMKCGKDIDARKVFDQMPVRNLFSWNNLLSGYLKLGMVENARRLFDVMPEKDVVSWNMMVMGCVKSGDCCEALRVYREFRVLGIGFSEFSFAGVLAVCVKLRELGLARQAHGQVLVAGFTSNVVLLSSVVDAYAKCGELGGARKLFDEMSVRDVLAWTTLVSGYAKWGHMESAMELFNEMPKKSPVSWTALIAGYARHGPGDKALGIFAEMMGLGIKPDQFTFSSCLCASASVASIKHGKQIHGRLLRTSFEPNTIVVSSLVDMYAKCGSLEGSERVFDLMGDKKDPVLWNTLISALAQHGHGKKGLNMLDQMIKSGVKPDRTTLVVILNACSHSGLVKEGLRCFESMISRFGIVPDQEHYACLIDLLGRAGCFDELMKQIENMPLQPDYRVWNAMLGVCRIHGNIELGRKAAKKLIELDPQCSAPYVLLSSIYAKLGKWESVRKVRGLMDKRCVWKDRAVSWIEVECKVHAFTVLDGSHPLKEEIYSALERLTALMDEDSSTLDLHI